MTTTQERAAAFRQLHEGDEAFVIPNPWDAGSARLLVGLGYQALATTSSGFAFTLGRSDGEVTLDEKLAHCRALSAAVDVPVSADLEHGFADDPEGVAETIRQVAETDVVGGSIEDYSRERIYDFDHAVERVAAAAEAAGEVPFPFTLTARAESLLRRHDDLDGTIRRLQAFEAAGADVLYAPGLKTLDEVRQVTAAVSKPVNVLAPFLRGSTVAEIAEAGAKRISVGGAFAYAAAGAVIDVGRQLLDEGSLEWLRKMVPPSKVHELMRDG